MEIITEHVIPEDDVEYLPGADVAEEPVDEEEIAKIDWPFTVVNIVSTVLVLILPWFFHAGSAVIAFLVFYTITHTFTATVIIQPTDLHTGSGNSVQHTFVTMAFFIVIIITTMHMYEWTEATTKSKQTKTCCAFIVYSCVVLINCGGSVSKPVADLFQH